MSRAEVVHAVQRFLDALRTTDGAQLATEVPAQVRDADDVADWAWRLIAASIEAPREPKLEEVCSVFSEAKKRLEMLALMRRARPAHQS